MRRKLIFSAIIALVVFFPTLLAQSATPDQQQIAESITINGQPATGVLVEQNGNVLTYTCSSPQQYVTADGSESGWACFDQSTGMWILRAQPPSQSAGVYSVPDTVYAPTYNYGYAYPAYPTYPYYPYYSYPYFWGPQFGLGFGFGFRSGHFNNGFHGGHGFHGGQGFAHGGFNHGGFNHGGGGFHSGGVVHGGGGGGFHGGGFHGGGGGFHGGMGGGHR